MEAKLQETLFLVFLEESSIPQIFTEGYFVPSTVLDIRIEHLTTEANAFSPGT
jgi:hypothetical protein